MKTLGLVFTQGVSLEIWVEKGLIDREKLIYEQYIKQGFFDKVVWFTYGNNDLEYYHKLVEEKRLDKNIVVVPMPRVFIGKFGQLLYSVLLPLYQKKICQSLVLIKTNQMPGAWTAWLISKMNNIPFVLRTGYTQTQICDINRKKRIKAHQRLRNHFGYHFYRIVEQVLYKKCDIAYVSSQHDKQYVEKEYGVTGKINVLPNYIDCSLFNVVTNYGNRKDRFLFVGRLSHEKNLFNTIKGVCEAGFGIDLYGSGGLQHELQQYIEENNYDAILRGSVDNGKLPEIYNSYKYYILASPFEGMPKTLLEAMACGLVCFATNSSGMKEIVKEDITGYLVDDTEWVAIKEKIEKNIGKDTKRIANNATEYIDKHYSIKKIVEVEQEWLHSCMM